MRRADRKLYSVDHHGETAARLTGTIHLVRDDLDRDFFSGLALPAEGFGRDLDKVDLSRPIQLRRQLRDVREAHAKRWMGACDQKPSVSTETTPERSGPGSPWN